MTWNSSSKCLVFTHGFPQKPLYCGLDSKESTCNAGDPGSIPGSGRSPGEGNDYPLHYFSLENSMDRGAWQTTIHGVSKSWTGLSDEHLHSSWFITVKWIRSRISKKNGHMGPSLLTAGVSFQKFYPSAIVWYKTCLFLQLQTTATHMKCCMSKKVYWSLRLKQSNAQLI